MAARTILGLGMRLRSPSRVSRHRSKCCRMLAGRSCADCSTRVRDRFLVPRGPQQLQHCSGNMDNTSPDTCSLCSLQQTIRHRAAGAGGCRCRTLLLDIDPACCAAVLQCCSGEAAWRHDMLTADEISLTHMKMFISRYNYLHLTSNADP